MAQDARRLARSALSVAACVMAGLLVVGAQGPAGQGGGRGRGGGPGGGVGGGRGQGRGSTAMVSGTASIAGQVVLDSGSPVRRAEVRLSGAGLGLRSTFTGDRGEYSFPALPAGRFTLTASRPGYVTIAYGAKQPGRQGTPIQLSNGQQLDRVNVTLPRGSVITGTVVDDHGEPAPNTEVRVYRYAFLNGTKALQAAGGDETDDRGIYRIFDLEPGDYVVSALPRNQAATDIRQMLQSQLQPLLQQLQAAGGAAALQAAAASGGAASALSSVLGNGQGLQLADRVRQLQQELQQQPPAQSVAYAPVYYPGTTMPGSAGRVTVGVGQERAGVDLQLQLVATARVSGTVTNPDGSSPANTQVTLEAKDPQDMVAMPGRRNFARVAQDGQFSFENITPGTYTLMAQSLVADAAAGADTQNGPGTRGGRRGGFFGGGRGGAGIAQVLWASADVTVAGQDVPDIPLNLQPGMTLSGRVAFDAKSAQPPTDLSTIRVNLQSAEPGAAGFIPPAQTDTSGQFTVTGVPPGAYSLRAGFGGGGRGARGGSGNNQAPAIQTGSFSLESAVVKGRDALDFPFDVGPNENISGAVLTFTDETQQISGTLQDAQGQPTSDYTVILFPADNRYWTPQSRRIRAARPGTDGSFSFRGVPPGDYRLTAVTDVEQGEWYDPTFLSQVVGASIQVRLAAGESKTQDIRLLGAR